MASNLVNTSDLTKKMRQRLQETIAIKKNKQAEVETAIQGLQKLFTKAPQKSRDTALQMDGQIDALEKERTETSLSLKKEKDILRQIEKIRRNKEQLKESMQHQDVINGKKIVLSSLRDDLRRITAQQAELEVSLSKLDLANNLGCDTTDLKKRVVDCPEGKMGQVIGKSGSKIKQLERKTGCLLDVDKVKGQIHLHGSDSALDAAVLELENITLSVDENMKLSPETLSYFFCKRMSLLNKLQKEHPRVHFDLTKETRILQLRGLPEVVSAVKDTVLSLAIQKLTRTISRKETALIVGKGGATVNQFVSDFDVGITVIKLNDEESNLEIVGKIESVREALAKIGEYLFENEDVEESVIVSSIVRSKLLLKSGVLMKSLTREISEKMGTDKNIFLVFEHLSSEEVKSSSTSLLLVRAPRRVINETKENVIKEIDAYEATVLTMNVSQHIIPSLIGKGGANINKLRKLELGAEIEVDKVSGKVRVICEDNKTREVLKEAIEKVIAENQIIKVVTDRSMFPLIYGTTGKEMRQKFQQNGVFIVSNNSKDSVTLRGSVVKITEAASDLLNFMTANYCEDYEYLPEDEYRLFVGGEGSILRQIQKEHDVQTNLLKSRKILTIRGPQNNVQSALDSIKVFLFGGDGILVEKMIVPLNLLGILIGKEGINIKKLEQQNDGVTIHTQRNSTMIVIKGPVNSVQETRGEITKLIDTEKVSDSFRITSSQNEKLSKPDAMKDIIMLLPVEYNLAESFVKLRGTSSNVNYVKSRLLEYVTGVYNSSVDLDCSLMALVCSAANNPSHLERIRTSTNTELTINEKSACIEISGKISNVRKAKTYIMLFLESVLLSQFSKVKVSKPLLGAVCNSNALAHIAARTRCRVSLDRDINSILVLSSSAANVIEATNQIQARVLECEKLNCILRLDQADAWLIPKITGQNGTVIERVAEQSNCKIDVLKHELIICIVGEKEESVERAKEMCNKLIQVLKKENVFIDIPTSAMSSFIGKSGSNIRKLKEEYNVVIERLKKNPSRIIIQGIDANVETATEAVEAWIDDWETRNANKTIYLNKDRFQVVLAKRDSLATNTQKKYGVTLHVNSAKYSISILGGTVNDRKHAIENIDHVILQEEEKKRQISTEFKKERIMNNFESIIQQKNHRGEEKSQTEKLINDTILNPSFSPQTEKLINDTREYQVHQVKKVGKMVDNRDCVPSELSRNKKCKTNLSSVSVQSDFGYEEKEEETKKEFTKKSSISESSLFSLLASNTESIENGGKKETDRTEGNNSHFKSSSGLAIRF